MKNYAAKQYHIYHLHTVPFEEKKHNTISTLRFKFKPYFVHPTGTSLHYISVPRITFNL
jgi:hypothetical protein